MKIVFDIGANIDQTVDELIIHDDINEYRKEKWGMIYFKI